MRLGRVIIRKKQGSEVYLIFLIVIEISNKDYKEYIFSL